MCPCRPRRLCKSALTALYTATTAHATLTTTMARTTARRTPDTSRLCSNSDRCALSPSLDHSRAGAARVQLLVGDPRYSTRVLKNETTFVFYSEPSLYSATPAVVSIFGDSRLLIAATVPHSLKDEPITIRFQRVNEVETHLTTGFARNSITAKSELDTSRKPARRSDRDRDDDVMVFIECVTPQFMPRESAAADGHDREGDARNSSDSESGTSSTTSEEDWSDVDEEGTQGIVTPEGKKPWVVVEQSPERRRTVATVARAAAALERSLAGGPLHEGSGARRVVPDFAGTGTIYLDDVEVATFERRTNSWRWTASTIQRLAPGTQVATII